MTSRIMQFAKVHGNEADSQRPDSGGPCTSDWIVKAQDFEDEHRLGIYFTYAYAIVAPTEDGIEMQTYQKP